jgi:FeS assembly protein IscX
VQQLSKLIYGWIFYQKYDKNWLGTWLRLVKSIINSLDHGGCLLYHYAVPLTESTFSDMPDSGPELFWDATYAIALALQRHYPGISPDSVGLEELAHMVEMLPDFADDPALANERILMDIQIIWFEEAT